jgi:hypothetical protein
MIARRSGAVRACRVTSHSAALNGSDPGSGGAVGTADGAVSTVAKVRVLRQKRTYQKRT